MYYLCTTAIAIIIGLLFANIFKVSIPLLSAEGLKYEAKTANVMVTIVYIFPSSFWSPLVNATMLQVIVISLFPGFGILMVGEKGKTFGDWISSANEVFMKIMMMIIKVAHIGVFCMMAWVVANQGPQVLGSLALVLLVAYIGYIVHAVLVYSASRRLRA